MHFSLISVKGGGVLYRRGCVQPYFASIRQCEFKLAAFGGSERIIHRLHCLSINMVYQLSIRQFCYPRITLFGNLSIG